MSFWLDVFQISTIFLQSLQQIFVFFHLNLHICHSWLTMLKITILISKDYDIDIYKISRYIAKMVVLLSPIHHLAEGERDRGKDEKHFKKRAK